MGAGRSIPEPLERRRALSPAERIVAAGAIAVAASMLLPWYGIRLRGGLSVTGLDSFGFGHAALLITVGAAVVVVWRERSGRTPPRPLRSAELVLVAGVWAALLTAFLMIDRPDELAGTTERRPADRVFVALGGCVAIVVGGMRMRVERRR